MPGSILRGVATVNFVAGDLHAASAWYTEFLGQKPYYETAAYIEFRLGDRQQELGIIDARFARVADPLVAGHAGATVYWHVENVDIAVDRAIAQGARLHEPPRDFGNGFIGATVLDPFGNILGLMYNPHYVELRDLATVTETAD